MNLDRLRFLAPLALLAVAACKDTGGLDESKVAEPATGEGADAAAPTDAGGFQLPFDITDLFPPRRDAGRPSARDAGNQAPDTRGRVGPQGGVLYGDGIALDVPGGAVTRSIELSFSELPSPPAGFVGRAWLISPPETRFAVPVRVAFQLTPQLLAVAPANRLAVATLQNGAWVALPAQYSDGENILVLAETQLLGAFALIAVPPRAPVDAAVPDASGGDASAPDASAPDAMVDAGPTTFCVPGACANGTCVEGLTDYGCSCNAGFTLAADLHSCADVDECTLGTLVCTGGKVCVNALGSAQCICPIGTELTPSDTCAAPGTYCLPSSCAPGTCVQGASDFSCTCPPGYAGTKQCADVDECATGAAACGPNTTCQNTAGSYACTCLPPNVAQADGTCAPSPCTPPLVPHGEPGSIICACPVGTSAQPDFTCI